MSKYSNLYMFYVEGNSSNTLFDIFKRKRCGRFNLIVVILLSEALISINWLKLLKESIYTREFWDMFIIHNFYLK